MNENTAMWIVLGVWGVLFAGDPDIAGAIIQWLSR